MIDGVMPDPAIQVRPATPADFEAIERVAAANDEPTTGGRWPGFLYLEHLLVEATLLVAVHDGQVIGYGGAAVVGGRRPAAHVTDLFVDPAAHGQGAGKRLLRGLFLEVDVPAWTTCSSADPRALTLYVRAGMQPLWPVLYLDAPLNMPAPEITGDWWPSRARARVLDPEAASALETGWSGRDFAVQYRHWAARPGGVAFAIEVDGRAVAVGVARDERTGPGRVVDHLAIAPEADPVPALFAALASDTVRDGARSGSGEPDPTARLTFTLPGPHPAIGLLLQLGARITDHDTFCTTDPDLVDPGRVVPDPSFG